MDMLAVHFRVGYGNEGLKVQFRAALATGRFSTMRRSRVYATAPARCCELSHESNGPAAAMPSKRCEGELRRWAKNFLKKLKSSTGYKFQGHSLLPYHELKAFLSTISSTKMQAADLDCSCVTLWFKTSGSMYITVPARYPCSFAPVAGMPNIPSEHHLHQKGLHDIA